MNTRQESSNERIVRRPGDGTVWLLHFGYRYISRRRHVLRAKGFQTRLFGRRTVFLAGPDAARQFYDSTRFHRHGAVPQPIRGTLFGRRTVHGLDGRAHRHRKGLFLSIMDQSRLVDLADLTRSAWHEAIDDWERRGRVVLFDETVRILGTSVCRWAGIDATERQLAPHVQDMATIVDNFGAFGLGQWRGRQARRRLRTWARRYVDAVRDGMLRPDPETALARIARHRDERGRPLPSTVAADELLNVLRPTVAVAWFVTFAAHALHLHPQWRHRLAWGDDDSLTAFAHEIRRFYPFAPMLAARVHRRFEWLGHRFPKRRRVLLDLYGTNHDPDAWTEPSDFDPRRFLGAAPDRYAYVPHGGGRADTGHRCPGEDATTMLLKQAVAQLARLEYRVPTQNLTFDYSRIPTRIRSGFVLADVNRLLAEPEPTPAERVGRP